jgi:hypothetical protein
VIAPDGAVLPETGSTSSHRHERQAAAQVLFEQGVRLAAEDRYAEACAKFEASEALDVGVGTLLHLADCYEHLGKPASAWATFREAESLARVHGMSSRQEIAIARAAALELKLSRLVVVVPPESKIAGLEIRLGNAPLSEASWGTAVPVDPGPQLIEARARGFEHARVNLEVSAESPQHYRVVVPKLEPLPPAAPVPLKSNEESLDHCPSRENPCTAKGVELREQASTYADLATVSAAAAGAFLIGGFALYAVAPEPRRQQSRRPQTTLNLAPTLTTTGAGVRVGGSW